MDVGVGGRDEAHVHLAGAGRSEALELSGLEHAQELGLLPPGDVGDLVEEEGSAVGELEPADAIGPRVREGAPDVPEELALEDALRDSPRVQRHERTGRAAGSGVQGARDHPFPRPVLAVDQDVGVGGSDPLDQLEDRAHGGGLRDHRRLRFLAQDPVLGFEALSPAERFSERDLCRERRQKPRVLPRLLHEVPRAAAHRLDRQVHRAPGRHDDDRQSTVQPLDPREQIEPLLAGRRVPGVVQVHQDGVVIARFERGQSGRGRGGGLALVAFALQQQPQGLQHVALVVRDQDARGGGGHRVSLTEEAVTRRAGPVTDRGARP